MSDHLLRVRLHGGRNTHAARTVAGDEAEYRITPCGQWLDPDAINHWLPADSPITCPACTRKVSR